MKVKGVIQKIPITATNPDTVEYKGIITAIGTKEEVEFFIKHAFSKDDTKRPTCDCSGNPW